jgi:hypothetical protein
MSFARRIPPLSAMLAAAILGACTTQVAEPPGGHYQKVSALVHFPDFYAGLGTLYVQPTTLPYGPFRGYDRNGDLVNTIFMVPLQDLDKHTSIRNLEGMPLPVDHVEIYFNSGHPGVDMPHYHIVLWHVSAARQKTLQ